MHHLYQLTPKELNGRGMDLLGAALGPYVDEQMRIHGGGESWLAAYTERESNRLGHPVRVALDDPRALLKILRYERRVFTDVDATQRAWIEELIQWSNRAAHSGLAAQEADRSLDTMSLLATSLGFDAVLDDLIILRAGLADPAAAQQGSAEQVSGSGSSETDGSGIYGSVRLDEPSTGQSDLGDPESALATTGNVGHERLGPDHVSLERVGPDRAGPDESAGEKGDTAAALTGKKGTDFVSALNVPNIDEQYGTRTLSARAGDLDVVVVYREAINYALVHNGVSPIADIYLANRGEKPVEELKFELEIESPFEDVPVAGPFSLELGTLAGFSETELPTNMLAWRLTTRAFLRLDESMSVDMHLRVTSSGGKFHAQAPIRLLPYDEWWAASIPEALAAFVRPNDSAIAELVGEASRTLEARTGSSSLDGYQSGPERVYQIAHAIYDAMAGLQITYVEPPPSFEGTGQRIRSHREVLSERRGTCLDLACTYAAALEFAGLHPVIVMCEGHAFAGYLTDDTQLNTVALSSNAAIRTVADSDLFDALETTGLTEGNQIDFDEARGRVRHWWSFDIEKVRYLLDVSRAHRLVRPLPSIRVENGQTIIEQVREVTAAPARKLAVRQTEEQRVVPEQREPARIARWRRSLLDMTYRNPLLKLKKAGTVPVHVPTGALGELEDAIAVGTRFTLVPHDDLAEIHLARGARTAADIEPEAISQILRDESRIFAAVTQSDYHRVFKGLARKAQTALEETGVNSLYMAVATLEWEERGRTGKAPVFLVPVKLSGGRGNRSYTVELDDTREVQPNYCLVEKLRVSWGLQLPVLTDPDADEAGLDIPGALATIRSELLRAGMTDFHVEETAYIALFQFSTLEMWRDLGWNWASFMDRPAVRHLVETPGQTYIDDVEIPPANGHEEADMYLPIPADGSQMEAVRWASAGKSFILEGPPGTGKSQTITNLIADLLAEGKKVLFVAEKQAALDVVRRRLEAVGLGEFSLNLHGRNQTVTKVREALRAALDAANNGAPSWEALQASYRNLVEFLARYPENLHEEGPAGLSAWDARQIILELGEASAVGPVEVPLSAVSGSVDLSELYVQAGGLAMALSNLGSAPGASPWSFSGPFNLDAIDAGQLVESVVELESVYQALHASAMAPLAEQAVTVGQLRAAAAWSALGPDALLPEQAGAIATAQWLAQSASALGAIDDFVGRYGPQVAAFVPEIFEQNLQDLLVRSEAADKKFFGKKKARRAIVAELQPFLRQRDTPLDLKEVTSLVRGLVQVREQLVALRQFVGSLQGTYLRPGWNPLHDLDKQTVRTNVESVRVSAELAREFSRKNAERSFVQETPPVAASNERGSAQPMLGLRGTALPAASPEAEPVILGFVAAWERFTTLLGALPKDVSAWLGGRALLDAVSQGLPDWKADSVNGSFLRLRRWNRVRCGFACFEEMGMTGLLNQIRSGELRPPDIENAVRAGAARAVLDERLGSTGLISFDEAERASLTQRFITAGEDVRTQLISELPAKIIKARTFKPNQRVGAVADLEKQLGRRRGGMAIRQLLHSFGHLITEITPCFLMSPNSVARFLPADAVDFDVVVFDEASQIRVPDAIGAMGRAKAVVIVGDSQQMPPSSMFAAAQSGDDSEDDSLAPVDMDSILSEAVESKLPSLLLSWHYRSRNESLIAFSNQTYYDGRLSSFPSPPDIGNQRAISLVNVHGTWEGGGRGAARVNRAEAEAIVNKVIGIATDEPGKTVGVVTFNSQQRDLILDMLESVRETNAAVEAAMARETEPLFVKNLENVQGDERDIILFTLAFAKGKNGRVPLNWGPLSRPGGEKRLNVAITRAKERVELFCSFELHELNLTTSHSIGLAHLKDYLLAAQSGIEKTSVTRTATRDLHLEEIAKALEAGGLEVRRRVGLSDFTVELGVRAPGQDWIAVLLDGPNWADRATVGDRDGLPQTILTGSMGWKYVYRVWLPSWLRNSQEIVDDIKQICSASTLHVDPPALRTTQEARDGAPKDGKRLDENREIVEGGREEPRGRKGVHGTDGRETASIEAKGPEPDGSETREEQVPRRRRGRHSHRAPTQAAPVNQEGSQSGPVSIPDGVEETASRPSGPQATPLRPLVQTPSQPGHSILDLLAGRAVPVRDDQADQGAEASAPEISLGTAPEKSEADGPQPYLPYEASQTLDSSILNNTSFHARSTVHKTVMRILDAEGPILMERLLRSTALEYGLTRLRESRKTELRTLVPPESIEIAANGDCVVWPANISRASYSGYRVPSEGIRRDIGEVPYVELRNAMVTVIKRAYSMSTEDALRETAREFGTTRLASKVRPRLETVLECAISEGILVRDPSGTIRVS